MFDNRKQSIPRVFMQKMEIDKTIDALKDASFVVLKDARESILEQRRLRKSCQIFCMMNKVTPESDGTPAGGSNWILPIRDAIAA